MASSRHSTSEVTISSQLGPMSQTLPSSQMTRTAAEDRPLPQLNIQDLRMIATDIKDTLSAAISELRIDIRALSDRVQAAELMADRQDLQLHKTTRHVDTHTLQLREMQRHLEDLDNRGRRHNLRVRGMPESIEGDQITHATTSLFNGLLRRPIQTPIEFERIHRALRPKGKDTDPPRDIICCLSSFKLKEEILKQARGVPQIVHEGKIVQIYQDLSGITLQHRRDLKPLLDALRANNITYKWKFPFCLAASSHGRTAYLKVPEDLPVFCDTLHIPRVEVPNWYADFRRSAVRRELPPEEPMEASDTGHRRRRSPSVTPPHGAYRTHRRNQSPHSPSSRRPRRGR